MDPETQIIIVLVIAVIVYKFGWSILDFALNITLAIVLLPFEAIRFMIAKLNKIEYHQMGLRETDVTQEAPEEYSQEPEDYPPHELSDYGNP